MRQRSFARLRAGVISTVLLAGLLSALASPGAGGKVRRTGSHRPRPRGSTTGAVNRTYDLTRKDRNLNVAKRLEALLEAEGRAVCMTRTGDETLSNNDRYVYANSTGAEVLISVHMNGSSNPATDYTTTLFGKWRKDKELAQTVFGSLSTLPAADGSGTIATRTPYSFASGVLLKSDMPATISETVFITSDREARLLSDGSGAPAADSRGPEYRRRELPLHHLAHRTRRTSSPATLSGFHKFQ